MAAQNSARSVTGRYDAVLFDLLTALLDSWSLWNVVAGDAALGRRWRRAYLELAYRAGRYRPYDGLVADAAAATGLPPSAPRELGERWDELAPWPEVPDVLARLQRRVRLAVVTNCSVALGRRAAARTGGAFAAIVTAEEAGWYKPDERPYKLALERLDVSRDRALYVAGSPYDVRGAAAAGLTVHWHDRAGLRQEHRDAPAASVSSSLRSLPAVVLASMR